MAGPIVLIVLTYLITIPTISTYSVLNRIPNKLDRENLLFNKTSIYSKSTFDKCVPVEAVRQIGCLFSDHHDVFRSICNQHQLCYACGFVHNITARQCAKLSRTYMYSKCLRKSDCLKSHSSILILLEKEFYRTSEFSFECYDECVLNYLYIIPE